VGRVEAVVWHGTPTITTMRGAHRGTRDREGEKALRDMSAYERGDYVKKQGWAKMPGEGEADGKVADQCDKLITS
jgi:hypothetical protein